MGELTALDFELCKSGVEFEEWTANLLNRLGIQAQRVGKNDSGVDILSNLTWKDKNIRFYIQCKYHNKPLGKAAVQEIFTGTAFYKDHGRPVVITNNDVTFETRRYAKELDVEIISAPQWQELQEIIKKGVDDDPNPREGLFGLMIAAQLNDSKLIPKGLLNEDEERIKNRKELKLQVLTDFEEAQECVREASYLNQRAAKFQERALELQKRALLRNLTYD